jgi:hypothetical protein
MATEPTDQVTFTSGAGDSGFSDFIRRVRRGDERAAEELVERYGPAIRRVVRVRLRDPRLQRLMDSGDICQSVFDRTAGVGCGHPPFPCASRTQPLRDRPVYPRLGPEGWGGSRRARSHQVKIVTAAKGHRTLKSPLEKSTSMFPSELK